MSEQGSSLSLSWRVSLGMLGVVVLALVIAGLGYSNLRATRLEVAGELDRIVTSNELGSGLVGSVL
ncbi:MAG TPA: hypothetical protein VG940_13300, partial [Gemmatimonadales bacterium]|nr:hypothetical protein [Gemmatimonadales bacterium]